MRNLIILSGIFCLLISCNEKAGIPEDEFPGTPWEDTYSLISVEYYLGKDDKTEEERTPKSTMTIHNNISTTTEYTPHDHDPYTITSTFIISEDDVKYFPTAITETVHTPLYITGENIYTHDKGQFVLVPNITNRATLNMNWAAKYSIPPYTQGRHECELVYEMSTVSFKAILRHDVTRERIEVHGKWTGTTGTPWTDCKFVIDNPKN